MASFDSQLDEELDLDKPIGQGCYGAVYEVKVNGVPCVAKRVNSILTGASGQEEVSEKQWRTLINKFWQECHLLHRLRHPNIVEFVGVHQPEATNDPRELLLVMEKLFKSLSDFIGVHAARTSLSIKLHILSDIVSGLLYVHSRKVIHRDLTASNILLTESLQAKVIDFGASRVINSDIDRGGHLTIAPGAHDYMPPEALDEDPIYDFKLDVFSFGHLALYIINGKYPKPSGATFKAINSLPEVQKNFCGFVVGIEVFKRLKWLQEMGEEHCLGSSIVHCLQDEAGSRPDMSEIDEKLTILCQKFPQKAHS